MILALDLGTRFGFATFSLSKRKLLAHRSVDLSAFVLGKHPGHRYAQFHSLLRDISGSSPPTEIAFEDAWHQPGQAGRVFNGLLAMTQVYAFQSKARLFPYAVGTIKKHASGDGRAKKPEMVRAAEVRWGFKPEDHNEADALCVLSLHLEKKHPV